MFILMIVILTVIMIMVLILIVISILIVMIVVIKILSFSLLCHAACTMKISCNRFEVDLSDHHRERVGHLPKRVGNLNKVKGILGREGEALTKEMFFKKVALTKNTITGIL